jgi:hypothetical protein
MPQWTGSPVRGCRLSAVYRMAEKGVKEAGRLFYGGDSRTRRHWRDNGNRRILLEMLRVDLATLLLSSG